MIAGVCDRSSISICTCCILGGASFKTQTGPACHAGPTRQSEIKGVLSLCKGASAKMPTPQLEILHLPGKDRNR